MRSAIGFQRNQKATVRALGLRHLEQTVLHQDTAQIRGMLRKVRHLVKVEEEN